ncbi:uncharacterized protein LOC132309649 [Cornus florida]|uniref:uncharacterized protein LOC132309649 n=1 Tax=Cornus florida TaxID=4283 RepID=UPI00289B2658|nr:uncharacterized protein LOC132309649 [Cornus florida]
MVKGDGGGGKRRRQQLRQMVVVAIVKGGGGGGGVGESQSINQINQTDLQMAMSSMRGSSYHGFVILLKMLLTDTPNSLPTRYITFLMPNDEQLSEVSLTADHLQDFILSHSIPTALLLNNLLHFPTGTLVPSGLPNKMLSVINNGRFGIFLNNARIVIPNVCRSSIIRCHGISTTLEFDNHTASAVATPSSNFRMPELMDSRNKLNKTKSSLSINPKRGPPSTEP